MLNFRSPLDGFRSPFGSRGASGVTFTDELTDNGATPVVISTSIATRQCFQRGRSNIVLSGTYSVNGGTPTGMAWRVGSGAWVRFGTETIGAGNWQGTLAIPASYKAQGTLEVKPVNGLNVTPASVSNITVSDIWVVNGQSNADGYATNLQSYTKTTYDWLVKKGASAWTVLTSDPWSNSNGSIFPALAELIDQSGIPPVFIAGATVDGTGFTAGDWTAAGLIYGQAETRMDDALTASGGCAGHIWIQGEADSTADATTSFYTTEFIAMLDRLDLNVAHFDGTFTYVGQLGEHGGAGIEKMRLAMKQLRGGLDARVRPGANILTEDMGDGTHYGIVQGNVDAAEAEAQLDRIAGMWFRSIYGSDRSAPAITGYSIGTGADAAKVTVTFDRAMENHTATYGWSVIDSIGARSVSSAAQGGSASQVVLTCDQALYGATTVSFGEGNAAIVAIENVAAQLREATAVSSVKYAPEYHYRESAGTGVGAAPVNTVAPSLTGSTNVGGTASAINGTYSGVPAVTVGSYQWQRSDDGVTGWADLSGATSATYSIQAGDVAKYIRRGEVASNAVGSAARAYTAASIAITTETPIAAWATDGELTELTLGNAATTGVSGTANVADNDGGNDAVTITSSTAGSVGASAFNTAQKTFNNGVNHVRFRVKDVGANAPWLRVGFINITIAVASYTFVRPSDGTKGATPGANVTAHTVTAEPDNWHTVDIYVNLAGADLLGNLQINFVSADGGSTINRTGTEAYSLHDLTIGY